MGAESVYSTQKTPPGECEEPLSIEFLINSEHEFQRRDQLEMLDRLMNDASTVQHQILCYQKEWCCALDTLRSAHEALLVLQSTLQNIFERQMDAERDWLAFWRINSETTNHADFSPGGWI
jgi:hypothetical protein